MRPLEVVPVDEQRKPRLAVLVAGKYRPGEKLVPQGLPEALHLAQRLWVLRPRLEVADPCRHSSSSNRVFPRQTVYCRRLSVSTSRGTPYLAIALSSASRTRNSFWCRAIDQPTMK